MRCQCLHRRVTFRLLISVTGKERRRGEERRGGKERRGEGGHSDILPKQLEKAPEHETRPLLDKSRQLVMHTAAREKEWSRPRATPQMSRAGEKNNRMCIWSDATARSDLIDYYYYYFQIGGRTFAIMNPAEQTVTWLIALGVLESPKKRVSDPESFLQSSLRDGVVLCRLLERLRPGSLLTVKCLKRV